MRFARPVLGLSFLLLSSREQDIVQYKPVSGRIWMQAQIGFRVLNEMPIILGIVPSVESPEAITKIPVYVASLIGRLVFT